MSKGSPGPQWVSLQEPATSSTSEEEPDSEAHLTEFTTLKRKGKAPVPQPTQKRPKLTLEPSRREQTTGEGPRGDASKTPKLTHQSKPKSAQRPMSRVDGVAGPSKPFDGKGTGALRRPSIGLDEPQQSLLNFRPIGSSAAKTKAIQQRRGKEKSGEDSGMDATSPPASPSPPPESSTKPKGGPSTSTIPERQHRPYTAAKPRKPSVNPRAKPTQPRKSIPTSTEVIEISSDDDPRPKATASASNLSRPPPSKRQSLPAIPKNSEIIIIDDSEEEPPAPPSRSAPPNPITSYATSVVPPVTPPPAIDRPVVKTAPLSKDAEDRMLRGNSSGSQPQPPQRYIPTETSTTHTHTVPATGMPQLPNLAQSSALQPEHPPTVASKDDMIVDSPVVKPSPSSLDSFQSRRPERPPQRPLSVDLRRLAGATSSPRNAKVVTSSARDNPLVLTPLSKSTLPRKPSSLRPNITNAPKVGEQLTRKPQSSSIDGPSSKPERPVDTRKDSLDIDMRGLKVGNVTPSPPLPQPSSSNSTTLPGPRISGKMKASRPTSSSSVMPARTSTSSGASTTSVPLTSPPFLGVKRAKNKQARLKGTTSSSISKDTRPSLSQPTQTLAEAITQASELNARKGSSKQDAIDLTSDAPVDSDASENNMQTSAPLPPRGGLGGAIASSQFLQSLIDPGDLGKSAGPSSRPSTPDLSTTISTSAGNQADSLQSATPARRPLLGRSLSSPKKEPTLDGLVSGQPQSSASTDQDLVPHLSTSNSIKSAATHTVQPLPVASVSSSLVPPPQQISPRTSSSPTASSSSSSSNLAELPSRSLTSTNIASPASLLGFGSTPSTLPTVSASNEQQYSVPLSEESASDDQLEYIDEPVVTNQDLDTDEMDVEDLLMATPAVSDEVRPSHAPRPLLSDGETEELVVATSGLAMPSTTRSSPDPLDMRASSSPGQPIPVSRASPADLRRSSRRSSASSNDPISLFADDEFETPPKTHSASPYDSSKVVATKTFGGFPSLNWKTFRQDVNNFTQKCYLAKDLPHSLQDHINCWSPIGQRFAGLRTVLECYIQENTAEDEPDAPMIEIINNVDDDPTPPWEFHYSNKMWHGEGVPPPDVSQLTSCGCTGKCDPRSKTCACLKRQQHYTGDATPDFAYDVKGRLKLIDYPIFECNDLCGCNEECRNRVVQHGRKCAINIKKTLEKGWGVFAGPKKIYQGTFVGIYAGELLTDEVGEERGFKYNKFGRTYLFDLDFHHLKEGNETWELKYTVDAYHAGNFTRFLNHSCDPNCRLVPCYINESNLEKPLLTVFTRRDIEPFEELCFSYSGEYPEDDDELDPRSSPSVVDRGGQAVYAKCACRAKNCTGVMFK